MKKKSKSQVKSTRPFLAVQRRIMRRAVNRGKRIHDLIVMARRLFPNDEHPVIRALLAEARTELADYELALEMTVPQAPGLYDFLMTQRATPSSVPPSKKFNLADHAPVIKTKIQKCGDITLCKTRLSSRKELEKVYRK